MIAIIDYGMGNAGSIRNMLTRIGAASTITDDPEVLRQADKLILPGVGAFDRAMANLETRGLLPVLHERVQEQEVPILGICLGMQLFSRSSEEGTRPGLGWIAADTVRFDLPERPGERKLRLPHMGWNTVDWKLGHPVLEGLPEHPRYYFVHTYHVRCDDEADVLGTTQYGIPFHAAVARGPVLGMQFHPEKSHKFGLHLMRRFATFEPIPERS